MSGHYGRTGYIYSTTVLSDYRNQGISKKLVDNDMDALDKEGKFYFVRAERDDVFGQATLIETSGGGDCREWDIILKYSRDVCFMFLQNITAGLHSLHNHIIIF